MASHTQKTNSKPSYVANLEAAYDAPSQAGFGSAVFAAHMDPATNLEH
jgi:hypothetical protein